MTGLRVALDVLPLAGERTGVGRFCAGLAGALLGREELELSGYAIARQAGVQPPGPARAFGLESPDLRRPDTPRELCMGPRR